VPEQQRGTITYNRLVFADARYSLPDTIDTEVLMEEIERAAKSGGAWVHVNTDGGEIDVFVTPSVPVGIERTESRAPGSGVHPDAADDPSSDALDWDFLL
jgi:hypothetical protein